MQLRLFLLVHILYATIGMCAVAPPSNPTCKSPYGSGTCTTQDGCDTGEMRILKGSLAIINSLITGYTVKGDCPTGLAGNLCCIHATDSVTPEEFVAYIQKLY